MAKAIIILGIIVVATSANATLYKCKSSTTGALYFRDTPCLKGDIQLSVTGTTTTSTTVTDWGNNTVTAPTTTASAPTVLPGTITPITVQPVTLPTPTNTPVPTISTTIVGNHNSSYQPLVITIDPANLTPAVKSPEQGAITQAKVPPGRYSWRQILTR